VAAQRPEDGSATEITSCKISQSSSFVKVRVAQGCESRVQLKSEKSEMRVGSMGNPSEYKDICQRYRPVDKGEAVKIRAGLGTNEGEPQGGEAKGDW